MSYRIGNWLIREIVKQIYRIIVVGGACIILSIEQGILISRICQIWSMMANGSNYWANKQTRLSECVVAISFVYLDAIKRPVLSQMGVWSQLKLAEATPLFVVEFGHSVTQSNLVFNSITTHILMLSEIKTLKKN